MSYTPRSLFRLLEDIDANRLLLPHIQRSFVWDNEQMERLFDSLMRDYPIQTFLFWRTKEEIRARRFMPIIDNDTDLSSLYDKNKSTAGVEKIFVLDGQQRLQTLHSIFKGGEYNNEREIREAYFDITAGEKEIGDGDLMYKLIFSNEILNLPMFRVKDLVEKYGNSNPMDIFYNINIDDLSDNLTNSEKKNLEKIVSKNLVQLHSILNYDKHFWIDELDGVARSFPYRKILEIFVRVNSGGTKLTAGDLMFAAMKEGWDDIEERVDQSVDLLNNGVLNIDSDFILKCLLLTQNAGAEIQTEKFYGPTGEILLKGIESIWDNAEQAFRQLRDFIFNDLHIFSPKIIRSYNALVPLFDFIYNNPKPNEASRILMTGYYHKAQLFNWYRSGTDAILNHLHTLVGKNCFGVFPLNEIKNYFKDSRYSVTELTEYHLKENRLRSMLLNIVYCDCWGSSPFDVAFKGNEPHIDHIYPQYMLRSKLNLTTSEINDIGNLRFMGATDNIRKRAELPSSYFNRLKSQGVPIEKHLLVEEYSDKPDLLLFDIESYNSFKQKRIDKIWEYVKRAVNPEVHVDLNP